MEVRSPLASIGLCAALLLASGCSPSDEQKQATLEEQTTKFEQSLDSIQDPKLRDAIADLGGSLLLLERARVKLATKPIDAEYGEDTLALLKHYPTPQALVDTYINGLFVLRKTSHSDYLIDLQPVFPFNFTIPDQFPFPHGLEWQSVTLSNNKVIPFQPEWSETDPGIQLSPSSSNLTNPDDLTVTYPFIDGIETENKSQPQPVSLKGAVEVVAPGKVLTFDLSKKDVGHKRTEGNITLHLLLLEKNYAEIELTNSEPLAPEVGDESPNPLLVQARDSTGQFLTRAGSINESAAQVAFYEKQLAEMQKQTAWSDAFEKQLTDEQKTFEHKQSSHYAKVYFNGLIDNLQVNVLDFSRATVTRKDLDLPVLRFDKNSLQNTVQALPMPVTVYDDGAASWLKDAALTEDQLKNSVTISQSVEDASAAHIVFDHPFTFNDDLVGAERKSSEAPVTFFTADEKGERGKPIELPTEAFELNPARGTLTYDLNLFPENPGVVVGSIPLFLATIEKGEIDAAKLPKGLSLKDNALIVDQKTFPADSWRFFAKDASGRYLKEILGVSHRAEEYGTAMFDVHYFYGQPTLVESYQRTDLNTVQYGFEVKLDKPESK
ncbi:lipoprotein [Pseudomonas fildesensis]|uniref:Lipoprotein n=2 Tax=Pseudomonas fildesensis TaxID=1674920 RepID=A0A0J8IUY9_9PSED|nr:lipoprotein [Pseudomonas fildesensis]